VVWYGMHNGMTVVMLNSDLNEFHFIFIDEKGYDILNINNMLSCPKKYLYIFVRNEQDYLVNYLKDGNL
jgi:hypothetical protein